MPFLSRAIAKFAARTQARYSVNQTSRLDTSRYKGHSFGFGATSLAADKGFQTLLKIVTLGRWKSDAFGI